ncbi:MAG: glycosyltransferase [Sulfurospirillaceae bacterium]|nr:glycosyltransferase [Sulfurospirillaceae bacterium]
MNSLKIVHCANFSESKYGAVYYAIDRKLSNGLIRNGHFVYDFSYREVAKNSTFFKSKKFGIKNTNNALLETIKNIEPDLLLLGHSELITKEILIKAKEMFPQMKIAMWWVDPFEKIAHIPERLKIIDAFFATTGTSKLNALFGKTHAKLSFFPNVCDNSIEKQNLDLKNEFDYDVIYVGRTDENRKSFISFLQSLNNVKLGIFGNTKDNLLLGADYYKTIKKAKIGLNYSRFNDIDMYSSDRIIQLTASGIMVMSPMIPNFKRLFDENEIIYFSDNQDFKEKLDFYLAHDDERIKIAKKGWLKAHECFNEKIIAKNIINIIYLTKNGN